MGGIMTVKAFTLDSLTRAVDETTKVVNVKELELNYKLAVVTTDETEYDITILEPHTGRVLVKGGKFTEPTECHLNGSTMGGSMLWMDRIAIGMCIEFSYNGHITTLPVKIIGWRINSTAVVSKTVQ